MVGICFALGREKRNAEQGSTSSRPDVHKNARSETDGGEDVELKPGSDRDSRVPGCRFLPCDVTRFTRPRGVLTDVLLKLTFDNIAYLEETCDNAAAAGLLPDSLSVWK